MMLSNVLFYPRTRTLNFSVGAGQRGTRVHVTIAANLHGISLSSLRRTIIINVLAIDVDEMHTDEKRRRVEQTQGDTRETREADENRPQVYLRTH